MVPRTVETVMLTPLGPSVGETSGLIVTVAHPGRAGDIPPRDRYCHSPTPPQLAEYSSMVGSHVLALLFIISQIKP